MIDSTAINRLAWDERAPVHAASPDYAVDGGRAAATRWAAVHPRGASDATLQHTVSHTWNHGIGEIIGAVIDAGMTLTQFVEHDSVPWNPFPEGTMVLGDDGEFRLRDRPERLPLSYTLQATRN